MDVKLSKNLSQQFADFLNQHPPQPFNNALRNLLLDYMAKHVHIGFPLYFSDFLRTMDDLFQLLDTAATEMHGLPD